jgi:hypothetical protein
VSKGAVSQVIQRAIGDAAFRRQLHGDPKKALAGFDLTTDERSAITSGDPGRLTALGVDQRMSKAFNLSGISAVSKSAVSPELTGAGASAFIDEGTGSRGTSAITTGEASASAANLRRIEGDLNVSAAREAEDVSGDFNAFDPGIVSNTTSAVRDAAQSANAMNLRRIEGDLNTASTSTEGTSALNTGASAFEGGLTSTTSAVTPGIETVNIPGIGLVPANEVEAYVAGGGSAANNATAFEPVDVSGDFNQLDPGMISGDSAARATDTTQIITQDGGSGLRPNELVE